MTDKYGTFTGGSRKILAHTAGAMINLSIFCKVGWNEVTFRKAVNLWVGHPAVSALRVASVNA